MSSYLLDPADCDIGEVRLVGGDSCNEGRVEVCMNDRWGTVCNNNPELAGAVIVSGIL